MIQYDKFYETHNSYEWGYIFLHQKGRVGIISIVSSYGEFGYVFSYHGDENEDFRNFLIKCDKGYLGQKFLGSKFWVPDMDKLHDSMIDNIIQNRRENNLSKSKARYLYNCVSDIDFNCNNEAEIFYNIGGSEYTEFDPEWYLDIPKQMNPSFENFWKDVWIPFIETIKGEVK